MIQDWRTDAPEGKQYHLRHWCVEGDQVGGSLLYKHTITTNSAGTCVLQMEQWFKHIASNIMVFCNGKGHFGNAYGEQNANNLNEILITTSQAGQYNIMITADRCDAGALNCGQTAVSYTHLRAHET